MGTQPQHRPINAGTVTGYRDNSCRCPDCRNAWQAHIATIGGQSVQSITYDPNTDRGCAHPGCIRTHHSHGLCAKHVHQGRYTDPNHPARHHAPCHPERAHYALGLCRNCYRSARHTPKPRTPKPRTQCSHPDGCSAPVHARTLCNKHYKQARRSQSVK